VDRAPNLHHLELFYHVARAGGITAATREMSYGIQQPAVSGQVARLERELGVRLFQRRPFRLTPAGEELYGFLAPFFNELPAVTSSIRGRAARRLRIAAPATILREHLPVVLAGLRRGIPDLELSLVDAGQREVFGLLEREEVDLAIAELIGRPPSGIRSEVLLSLPLVLLLPPGLSMPRRGLGALVGKAPLVRTPDAASVSRVFEKGLAKRGLRWPVQIEVDSLELVHAYVSEGFGIGLGVRAPGVRVPGRVGVAPLRGFPQMRIACLWRGRLAGLAEELVEALRARAAEVA